MHLKHLKGINNVLSTDIISCVKSGNCPPFRPAVTEVITGVAQLSEVMKQCWVENPEDRHDFQELKKIMHKVLISNGMYVNNCLLPLH